MKDPKVGQAVIVYDGVQVQLTESNNPNYPIGCDNVWVSRRQLRRDVP